MKVLILGAKSYSTRRLLYELKAAGLKAYIADPSKFVLSISDKIGHDKIYYNGKRIFRNTIDFVIPRIGSDFVMGCKVLQHLSNNLHIPTLSTSEGLEAASDKFKASQLLSENKIKTPRSVYFQNAENYKLLIKLAGGYPVVAKLLRGSQGNGVFILNDDLAGSTALSTISKVQKVLLQQYIETSKENAEKSDIRVFVVNGKVMAAMRRYSIKGDFRSNYSISKTAEKVKLTSEQEQLALNAAAAFNLGICGVDIVTDSNTKIDYIIELNGNPGIGIEKVTGINVNKEISMQIKSILAPMVKGQMSYLDNPLNKKWVDRQIQLGKIKPTQSFQLEEERYNSDIEFSFDDPDNGISINDPVPDDILQEEFKSRITEISLTYLIDDMVKLQSLCKNVKDQNINL
jgi:ribosomal protein S6--L-glutamate ligase